MEELDEIIQEIRPYNEKLESVRCLVTMYTKDIDVIKGEEVLRNSKYDVFTTHIRYAGVLRSTKKHKVLVDFKVPGTGMNESAFYEDLLIFKGFTMDGINTEAVRTIVKSTIDVQIKAQNYLNTLFDNGLTNKMVIQLTSDIRDEKELKKIQEKVT